MILKIKPWLRFVLIQSLGTLFFFGWLVHAVTIPAGLLSVSILSAIFAKFLHDEPWWVFIHGLFLPIVIVALSLELPSYVYLIAFVITWLLFGQVASSRVPLFLSESQALAALNELIPENARFLDVGAGTGRVLANLCLKRKDLKLFGVENAFLPWLIGKFSLPVGVHWSLKSYQAIDFSDFDCIYAYLSPAAMPELWRKAQQEMKPGALLISNSFEIQNHLPVQTVELDDWKNGKLLIWQM
ncbi:class I SAM-dependent methyltransferase [Chitinibacter bivalviorum]|uniref:Class I SAM-dependent methyltransferase n=1 Tax=Chitinibacter bivalviorum TaxID=2739434 RepID=A0A7H9BI47_9NEIS|nr:class I SAM-dependent methyltransferase [Chitinibacter bivalviorum]QLG87878.1 class I SAM-dependent methyltransferase [Chitinibacter bivalviorum]